MYDARAPTRGARFLRWLARSALLLGLTGLLGGALLWISTPSAADLQARVDRLLTAHHASLMRAAAIPPLLADAVIATEDERFYENHGIDLIGVGRALVYDVSHLCACQGGSTITEQLVKDVYLGGSDAGPTKLVDMVLALKVAFRYSKAQVLTDYLSEVPTGYGRYGMPNAACAYFHRPLGELDLGQLALLAGLPQAPSALDPLLHPAAALARRAQVLDAMVDDGYVTAAQAAAAAREPPVATAPGGCR